MKFTSTVTIITIIRYSCLSTTQSMNNKDPDQNVGTHRLICVIIVYHKQKGTGFPWPSNSESYIFGGLILTF